MGPRANQIFLSGQSAEREANKITLTTGISDPPDVLIREAPFERGTHADCEHVPEPSRIITMRSVDPTGTMLEGKSNSVPRTKNAPLKIRPLALASLTKRSLLTSQTLIYLSVSFIVYNNSPNPDTTALIVKVSAARRRPTSTEAKT